MVRDWAGWTPRRSHSHDGMEAIVSGVGCSISRSGATGPGAGSPWRRTSSRNEPNACLPVTFCSRIEGTSDSITSPVRPMRQWRWVRHPAATSGWWCGSKADGSSSAPSSAGIRSSAHSAPGPQARPRTSPADALGCTHSVAGPSGVRMARQIRPDSSCRCVGSPAPRRCGRSTCAGAHGQSGTQVRVRSSGVAMGRR